MSKVPRVAFLGVCEHGRYFYSENSVASYHNLLGLSRFVISFIYPLNLATMQCVFAVYDIGAKGIGRVFIKNAKGEQVFRVDFSGSSRPEPIQEPGSTLTSASLPVLAIENMPAWHTVLVPLKDVVVPEPQTLSVYYEENSIEQSLGFLVLGLLEVPMPTPERIAALKSDPRANKVAMIRLGCKTCDSHLSIYAAIEKKGDPPKDAIWYQDLGEIFECTCGSTNSH